MEKLAGVELEGRAMLSHFHDIPRSTGKLRLFPKNEINNDLTFHDLRIISQLNLVLLQLLYNIIYSLYI